MASSIPMLFLPLPILLLLASTGAQQQQPLGPSDFLKTDGTRLRNAAGQVVQLRGVNLGGWLIQEKWMSPMDSCDKEGCNVCGCPRLESDVMCPAPDEISLQTVLTKRFGWQKMEELLGVYRDVWIQASDLDAIQRLGLNLVRVPIFYRNFMDDQGQWRAEDKGKDNVLARLDWLLAECGKRGIYVMLDLHGTAGQQNMWDNSGRINRAPELWTARGYQDETMYLWLQLAKRFKGQPALAAYDLINEPDRMDRKVLNDFYDRLYKEIRKVDPEHIVVIEAPWDFTILDTPVQRGWTNVVYSMHVYDIAHWYNREKQEALVENYLAGIRSYQKKWAVPVNVGEFCLFKEYDLWEKFINELNALDVSWTSWSYKMIPEDFGPFYWAHFVNNTSPIPNPASDSAEEIAQKWKKFGTENFVPNTNFQQMIGRCAKGDCSQKSTNGAYSIGALSNALVICTVSMHVAAILKMWII